MKILICHNAYRQQGGEDLVVELESALLREHGHDVIEYRAASSDLDQTGPLSKIRSAFNLIYAPGVIRDVRALVERERPDVAHIHNVFPLLTPSLYAALHRARVPVVQTLHNYRFLCPNGLFFVDGEICQRCAQGHYWHGVLRRCLHGDLAQSLAYASSIGLHWQVGTFPAKLGLLIAVSPFVARMMAQRIGTSENIRVVPNCIDVTRFDSQADDQGYALFIGRLSAEKGVDVLLRAALQVPDLPVKIMGKGPAETALRAYAIQQRLNNVEFLGYIEGAQRFDILKHARCLVVPSRWHEPGALVVLEAYAHGIPIIASRVGGLQDQIRDNETGLLFEHGDHDTLATHLQRVAHDTAAARRWGQAARRLAEVEHSLPVHYRQLMAIYREAQSRM
jgi:glycosyltransferase involved in cell wall biosynthesis